MHCDATRHRALELLAAGRTLSEVAREVRASRSAIRAWRAAPPGSRADTCPRCGTCRLAAGPYAELLGYYLGDGCISQAPRCFALRVSCDAAYPGIIEAVAEAMTGVRPGMTIFRVRAPGVIVVQSHWKHWPCLFPQHGPGRKHERPIVLEPWQRDIVQRHPGPFLAGLFHSDGCRVRNWATRTVAGQRRRYDYPRWQFTNVSPDILALCRWALDLVEVPWRQSSRKTLSVSTRAGVARLDELIGPKT